MKLDDAIGFIINNTGRNLILLLNQAFSKYGITAEQWTVLKRLDEQDGISIKGLTKRVGKDQGNVTRIVDVLVKKGVVKRTSNPEDKRSSLVYLTEEGKEVTKNLIPIDKKVHDTALHGLSQEDLTLLKQILFKINENVNKQFEK